MSELLAQLQLYWKGYEVVAVHVTHNRDKRVPCFTHIFSGSEDQKQRWDNRDARRDARTHKSVNSNDFVLSLLRHETLNKIKELLHYPTCRTQLSKSGLSNSKSGGKHCRLCVRVPNLRPRPTLRLDPTSWVV